jgi:GWxTD domain-containing protein
LTSALSSSVLLAATLVIAGNTKAPELDKKATEWLEEVRLLLLPEEAELFPRLDPADREEFRRLFWARRSADPRSVAAEGPDAYRKLRAHSDARYSYARQKGSRTGCGQVLALLGEPDERIGRELKIRFDSREPMEKGALQPETWVYKSREGRLFKLPGAELRLEFDDTCRFVESAPVAEELRRAAQALVVHPGIAYDIGPSGRLVGLRDALAAASPAQALLAKTPADFPLEVELKLLLRDASGAGFAAGLARGRPDPASLTTPVLVAAEARDSSGKVAARFERRITPAQEGDGVVAGWGLSLPAGRYKVRVGLGAGSAASVTATTVEVPRFEDSGLVVTPLFLATEAASPPPGASGDPYAPFVIGASRLVPRFGNVFRARDALQVVAVLYGGSADPTTGKAALRTRYVFLKDGKPVARDEQVLATPSAVASVGPVPLGDFAPGLYMVRLEVTDESARRTETRDAPFEIRP